MSTNLHLSTSAIADANRDVLLTIKLTNDEDKDYFIPRKDLLLDRVRCSAFNIVSGPSEINCNIPCLNLNIEERFFKLKAGETITNVISISSYCDFSDAEPGLYTVQFHTKFFPCIYEDYQDCEGRIRIMQEAVFEIFE